MNETTAPAAGPGAERICGIPKWLLLVAPAAALLAAFLVAPLVGLVRTSLYPGPTSFESTGWSLAQYRDFFSDWYFVDVLFQTFRIGVIVSVISLVLGFPVGYSLARLPPAQRRWRLIFVILPLTLSLVVVVFGWLVVLGRNGIVNAALTGLGIVESPQRLLFTEGAVILVLVQQFLPFMILSVMSVVSQIDPVLEQAAANLRANRFVTFRRVILPLAMPGILSGMTLVFILTISAFITPRLIGGNQIQMLGNIIYEQIVVLLRWPFGAAMSLVLLVITLITITAVNGYVARRFMTPRSREHAR